MNILIKGFFWGSGTIWDRLIKLKMSKATMRFILYHEIRIVNYW